MNLNVKSTDKPNAASGQLHEQSKNMMMTLLSERGEHTNSDEDKEDANVTTKKNSMMTRITKKTNVLFPGSNIMIQNVMDSLYTTTEARRILNMLEIIIYDDLGRESYEYKMYAKEYVGIVFFKISKCRKELAQSDLLCGVQLSYDITLLCHDFQTSHGLDIIRNSHKVDDLNRNETDDFYMLGKVRENVKKIYKVFKSLYDDDDVTESFAFFAKHIFTFELAEVDYEPLLQKIDIDVNVDLSTDTNTHDKIRDLTMTIMALQEDLVRNVLDSQTFQNFINYFDDTSSHHNNRSSKQVYRWIVKNKDTTSDTRENFPKITLQHTEVGALCQILSAMPLYKCLIFRKLILLIRHVTATQYADCLYEITCNFTEKDILSPNLKKKSFVNRWLAGYNKRETPQSLWKIQAIIIVLVVSPKIIPDPIISFSTTQPKFKQVLERMAL